MGVDWKEQLGELYKRHSKNKKDKKPGAATAKDNLQNFRGRKGFNDTGIPLTERAAKQQRRNKLSYKKYNYAGSRLNFINDARAEAARKHRMDSPQHRERVDKIIEIADREIKQEEAKREYQRRVNRSWDSTRFSSGSENIKYGGYGYSEPPDNSIEFTDYDLASAGKSVINQDPVFKNKIEEEIWRLKNNKT